MPQIIFQQNDKSFVFNNLRTKKKLDKFSPMNYSVYGYLIR